MPTITAEMEAELVRLFTRFDTDRSGLIDEAEFGKLLDRLGYDTGIEVRNVEFAAIDADADGKVTFREFAGWWLENK